VVTGNVPIVLDVDHKEKINNLFKNKNMKPKIIKSEIVLTNSTTNANITTIMQEVATLIYADVTQ
jgi:hypothetical protein